MKKKDIEIAIGYRLRSMAEYNIPARFETRAGHIIGGVRHSATSGVDRKADGLAVDDNNKAYWHYHETDGEEHCTRSILATDIVRVAVAAP